MEPQVQAEYGMKSSHMPLEIVSSLLRIAKAVCVYGHTQLGAGLGTSDTYHVDLLCETKGFLTNVGLLV